MRISTHTGVESLNGFVTMGMKCSNVKIFGFQSSQNQPSQEGLPPILLVENKLNSVTVFSRPLTTQATIVHF